MGVYTLAIDQGTTSTRAAVFDAGGSLLAISQREHESLFPKPGWVEQDAMLILRNAISVAQEVLETTGIPATEVAAIGIDNQTETTVLWDKVTGEPLYNAIVWQDTRGQDLLDMRLDEGTRADAEQVTRLPFMQYFALSKIRWILANVADAERAAQQGRLCIGSIDSWLTWHLSGGPDGGVHITDPTNASRTLLMDMAELTWSPTLAELFGVPLDALPRIVPSGFVVGEVAAIPGLEGIPLAARMGDQQAATFGQACFSPGSAKCTYGTGTFLIANTGSDIVASTSGLLTTVVYQIGQSAACYGLEGSVAVTGSLIQWLRDSLGILTDVKESEQLALQVEDNGGVYFVPAFSGLLAPRWRPDARGTVVGLTRYATKAHLARAALEACAFQTGELIDAIADDWGHRPLELKVDGGMTANGLLMQLQADLINMPVVLPSQAEATVLGVANAAGLAVGMWSGIDKLADSWAEARRWNPQLGSERRAAMWTDWNRAVERSFGWATD